MPHSEETRQEFLQIIKEESEKLQELIENLLDTSRIQAGSFAVEKRPTDIAELAQKVVEKVQSVAGEQSFLLHLDSLPSVSGDSRRLEQVLHNLLDNAIKYSPQGSQITISAADVRYRCGWKVYLQWASLRRLSHDLGDT